MYAGSVFFKRTESEERSLSTFESGGRTRTMCQAPIIYLGTKQDVEYKIAMLIVDRYFQKLFPDVQYCWYDNGHEILDQYTRIFMDNQGLDDAIRNNKFLEEELLFTFRYTIVGSDSDEA